MPLHGRNFFGMFVLVCGRAVARLNSGVRPHEPQHLSRVWPRLLVDFFALHRQHRLQRPQIAVSRGKRNAGQLHHALRGQLSPGEQLAGKNQRSVERLAVGAASLQFASRRHVSSRAA